MFAREDQPHAAVSDFERTLASLSPAASSVNRDELMYRAGRAAALAECSSIAPVRRWIWPTGSSLAALAAGLLGLWIGLQSATREARPIAGGNGQAASVAATDNPSASNAEAQPVIASPPPNPLRLLVPPADSQDTYLNVRNHVLARGVDAWRSSSARGPSASPPAESYYQLRGDLRGELFQDRPTPALRDPAARAFNPPGVNT
jgi:hypothetical protein